MKSHIRQFIEKHCQRLSFDPEEVYNAFDEAEKELMEAIEKDNEPAKGMQWVKASEKLPEKDRIVLFDLGEKPPVWGKVEILDKRHYLTTWDGSGEEESDNLDMDSRWLDEKNNPEQFSREEEKILCYHPYWKTEIEKLEIIIGGLRKENREIREHLADMKGFFADGNTPL